MKEHTCMSSAVIIHMSVVIMITHFGTTSCWWSLDSHTAVVVGGGEGEERETKQTGTGCFSIFSDFRLAFNRICRGIWHACRLLSCNHQMMP